MASANLRGLEFAMIDQADLKLAEFHLSPELLE